VELEVLQDGLQHECEEQRAQGVPLPDV
jgi:hypothetical protein